MREYGVLHSSFWTSPSMQGLSDQAKLLAAYLICGPHTTMLGCFRLPAGYITEDLGWPEKKAKTTLAELFQNGFIGYDQKTSWIHIRNFLTWNPLENPNQGKAAEKQFEQLPDWLSLKADVAFQLLKYASRLREEFRNSLETLWQPLRNPDSDSVEPFRNQNQEQKQNQEQRQEQNGRGAATVPQLPANPPGNKEPTPLQTACRLVWGAYSSAYFDRYGTEPVRNAKVNSQVKQFVQLVGQDEAQHIAAFYVGLNKQFYVAKLHDLGLLVTDAQAIRTQWATGNTMTYQKAQQIDRMQTNANAADEAFSLLTGGASHVQS